MMMTSMRYRDIAAHGRDEHKRDREANKRLARVVLALKRARALGGIPPRGRDMRAK